MWFLRRAFVLWILCFNIMYTQAKRLVVLHHVVCSNCETKFGQNVMSSLDVDVVCPKQEYAYVWNTHVLLFFFLNIL